MPALTNQNNSTRARQWRPQLLRVNKLGQPVWAELGDGS